jgi:hypothetical protein
MRKLTAIFAIIIGLSATFFAGVSFSESSQEIALSSPNNVIAQADSLFDDNSENTDNVYQQIVVANWGVREMAKAVALEVQALSDRTEALIPLQQQTSSLLAAMVALLGIITVLLALNFLPASASKKIPREKPSSDGPNQEVQI